jgi:hypothetical protein
LQIGNGDDRIIEAGVNVHLTMRDRPLGLASRRSS